MTDEARLNRWLTSHRDAVAMDGGHAGGGPQDHIDMDTLARFAVGQLSHAKARMVNEHLLACDDGRCGAFVRSQAADVDGTGEMLYGRGGGGPPGQERDHGGSRGGGEDAAHERTFQSREIIWQTFESMARELDAPIDDLVNEAMAAYAKVRGYPKGQLADPHHAPPQEQEPDLLAAYDEDRDPLEETHDAPSVSALDRSYAPRAPVPAAGRPAPAPAPPPMPAPLPLPPPASRNPWDDDDDLARTAARGQFARPSSAKSLKEPGEESRTSPRFAAAFARPINVASTAVPAPPPPAQRRMSPPAIPSVPPPLPRVSPNTIPMPGAPSRESSANVNVMPHTKRLVITYQGRPYNVDKDRFLIGRSKTQADLRLDDPNVSRQHAVIEHVGAAWYIVDLGSTNGVNVAGERVARRALSDGDVIIITSHEMRCSLR